MRALLTFTYLQALSCIFPVIIFGALALSKFVSIPFIPRYDFILLICLLTQVAMIVTKLETIDELKVICVFHLIGLALELFKVHMGSWSYPEEAYSKIYGVPLYSGFMYASVASYICQSWRRLDLQIKGWPNPLFSFGICVLIYLNFFTHHYLFDARWILILLLFPIFYKTVVHYTINERVYKMPILLSFLLIGFFIWIAENITTFLGAWQYPNQEASWSLVHIGKISSWFLLVIISIIIVAQLKRIKSHQDDIFTHTKHL
ncbi:DUF817 domain-containing protein [Fictibacillus phosphorivorans]|uniref:DUF817 domain-containing protein n=1 Tax=Fictibacillus phosphorivorans TaxID=1221500 RepID=UPI003CF1AFC9